MRWSGDAARGGGLGADGLSGTVVAADATMAPFAAGPAERALAVRGDGSSGYTMNACTARWPCFTVTHSPWRGDFSSACLAQSCAAAGASSIAGSSRAATILIITEVYTFAPHSEQLRDAP